MFELTVRREELQTTGNEKKFAVGMGVAASVVSAASQPVSKVVDGVIDYVNPKHKCVLGHQHISEKEVEDCNQMEKDRQIRDKETENAKVALDGKRIENERLKLEHEKQKNDQEHELKKKEIDANAKLEERRLELEHEKLKKKSKVCVLL